MSDVEDSSYSCLEGCRQVIPIAYPYPCIAYLAVHLQRRSTKSIGKSYTIHGCYGFNSSFLVRKLKM